MEKEKPKEYTMKDFWDDHEQTLRTIADMKQQISQTEFAIRSTRMDDEEKQQLVSMVSAMRKRLHRIESGIEKLTSILKPKK